MLKQRVWRQYLYYSLFLGILSISMAYGQELQLPQRPLEGQKLFVSKGCVKCHSIFGQGASIGSDLGRTQANKKTMDIVAAMWNHSSEMSQAMVKGQTIPQLNPQEMAGILSFLYYLNYFDEPGSSEEGEKIFLKKGCIKCHRVAGKGGDIGPALDSLKSYVSALFLAQEMWNHGAKMIRAMQKSGIEIPIFEGNEMADVLAYLQSVGQAPLTTPSFLFPGSPSRGARLFEEKKCIQCHKIDGQGRDIGPNLSKKEFHKGVVEIAGMMWNHAPKMWGKMREHGIIPPKFHENDMADIIAFLYFLEFRVTPGEVDRGRQIFSQKGCIKCHSVNDNGNKVGPNLARARGLSNIITISSAMWNHNIKMRKEMKKRNIPFPRFNGEELKNLLTFIRYIREQENGTD